MTRHFWVLIHRWVGLATAGFLIIVGFTGSLLAFLPEVNHLLTPHLFSAERSGPPLKLSELALAAQELLPQAAVKGVTVDSSGAAIINFTPQTDPATGKPYELGYNRLILDAATGQERGRRMESVMGKPGSLPANLDELMPFLYRLHYNLSLGVTGRWILGIVALLWTLDCFVSFYLTLPARRKQDTPDPEYPTENGRSFWQRWKPAWQIKLTASPYRINFDLHRAGGLWLWAMLLIFAWSSVAFNLKKDVYEPIMRVFFDLPKLEMPTMQPPPPNATPLGWREVQTTAERLMQEQAEIHGFSVAEPNALSRIVEMGVASYRVRSSLDIQDKWGNTFLMFDLYSGQLLLSSLPTTLHSGVTISTWLRALHMADVFGLPYRIFVCVLGLVIVMLSVTGIIIWLRKRRVRQLRRLA